MKIQMTSTVQGSLDGETVQELRAGDVYESTARLARYHIKQGVALPVPIGVLLDKVAKAKAVK